ncbi:hypothetical protein [Actinospongicola halichondriae]|uniref:hypothetical protein n=1 Tax=Actinospongicola halichondriae TaxID=3236844 RepID=UPI003D3AB262
MSPIDDPAGCGATGCGWYHGAWPLLRSLGLVATPDRHAAFFHRTLGSAAEAGLVDVVVSGAADDAMPSTVLAAYRARSVTPSITVIDRCATPIDRIRAAMPEVSGLVADVLAPANERRFDLACTHGLFPTVPVDQRKELAAAWASMLVPGGRLVTTTSLSSPDAPDDLRFDPAAVDAFVDRAIGAFEATEHRSDAELSAGDVERIARRWATNAVTHPTRSTDEIADVLSAVGFDVDVHEQEIAGTMGASTGGPWSARTARYAEVVATRR